MISMGGNLRHIFIYKSVDNVPTQDISLLEHPYSNMKVNKVRKRESD